ncbi:RICIN domain-containing protein [Streptomyces sp. NPDC060006]|uniref:RICIN domain-containing protein n=1 Tax=unclassified Streptomyces TaxID=2593676 RepID=UPI00369BB174
MSTLRKIMVGAAGMALAATSVLFSSSPAGAGEDQPMLNIVNQHSGKCLAVPADSTANGKVLIQWECNDNLDQEWYAEWIPGGDGNRYRIRNYRSGKCLAIGGSSTALGANAIQWTCSGNDDQKWIWDSAVRLRNVHSDHCLAVPNSSLANGTELVQWTCTLNSDQGWIFDKLPNP